MQLQLLLALRLLRLLLAPVPSKVMLPPPRRQKPRHFSRKTQVVRGLASLVLLPKLPLLLLLLLLELLLLRALALGRKQRRRLA